MNIDEFFSNICEMNENGTLTVEKALFGYYRLREGEYAGKVIIKSHGKIDDREICLFANGLTWIFIDDIKDIKCEQVYPYFSNGKHSIDRSKASWCNDGSSKKSFYEW